MRRGRCSSSIVIAGDSSITVDLVGRVAALGRGFTGGRTDGCGWIKLQLSRRRADFAHEIQQPFLDGIHLLCCCLAAAIAALDVDGDPVEPADLREQVPHGAAQAHEPAAPAQRTLDELHDAKSPGEPDDQCEQEQADTETHRAISPEIERGRLAEDGGEQDEPEPRTELATRALSYRCLLTGPGVRVRRYASRPRGLLAAQNGYSRSVGQELGTAGDLPLLEKRGVRCEVTAGWTVRALTADRSALISGAVAKW